MKNKKYKKKGKDEEEETGLILVLHELKMLI